MLKVSDIEISADNPFANDLLGRKKSADALTNLIVNSKQNMVLAIDSPWGFGKTTFLKMWKQELSIAGIPTLYYNAWENDFSDNALVSMIGEISSSLEKLIKTEDDQSSKKLFEDLKNIALVLIKTFSPIVAGAVYSQLAVLLGLGDKVAGVLETGVEKVAEEEIQQYEKSKESLANFRETLRKFAASLTNDENYKPLIFIIDELDRCRPNFAIEILEKAKHFFNVENVVFVLGVDKTQLGHAIKPIYGNEIDTGNYFRRLIDIEFRLPEPNREVFLKSLFEVYFFDNYFSGRRERFGIYDEENQFFSVIQSFSEIFDLSLREIQHCCAKLNLAVKVASSNTKFYPLLTGFLIILNIKNKALYDQFLFGDATAEKVLDFINTHKKSTTFMNENYGYVLEVYLFASKIIDIRYRTEDTLLKQYEEKLNRLSDGIQKERVKEIIARFGDRDFRDLPQLKFIKAKLEFLSQFDV